MAGLIGLLTGSGDTAYGAPSQDPPAGSASLFDPSPPPMTIMVDNSFPAEPRVDLATVAGETLAVVRQRFPGPPPAGSRPIVCIYDPSVPEVAPTGDQTPYIIKIGVKDRQFDQFAYQLGHELGHVMLDPRRTSGLDETCAFAVSYRVLDDLAVRWAADPPFEGWRSYAPNFTAYRVEDEKSHLQGFPEEVKNAVARRQWNPVSLYLRFRREDQDRNAADRDLNSLGAIMLCAHIVNWADMAGLASHTVPSPAQSPRFSQAHPVDISALSPAMRTLLQTLGRGCTSAMAAVYFKSKPELPVMGNAFLFQAKDGWVWLFECAPGDCSKYGSVIGGLNPVKYSWDINDKISAPRPHKAPVMGDQ